MTATELDRPEAFCAAVRAELVGSLTLLVGDRSVAEELAQEALVRAWQRWARLDNPRAWTYRTAFNLASSRFRRRQAERQATRRLRAGAVEVHTDPDSAVAISVREAVAALPARQRQVIAARYYAELSVAEAATVMGCAEGTVKALTSQAIASLRRSGLTVDEHDEVMSRG